MFCGHLLPLSLAMKLLPLLRQQLPHWTFKSSSCKFNHLCFQIFYFFCVPKTGICTRSDTAPSKSSLLKAKITKIFWKRKKESVGLSLSLNSINIPTWMCILITAFPMRVAPKNVQKGTRKWPQVMPARSNSGFGMLEEEIEVTSQKRKWSLGWRQDRTPGSSKDAKEANPLN